MELIEVRKSIIEGNGVFASSPIIKGQKICLFKGKKVTIPELKKLYETGEVRHDDPFQIGNQLYILLDKPYIYFNHSCAPNAGLRGKGEMFALRDIPKGQEITFDYSTTEWTDDEAWGINWHELWKITCTCGSDNCRKEIRVFPFLPKIQQNYFLKEGALMDFIVAKM